MSNYEPDWSNTRTIKPVLRRITSVLEFCRFTLNELSATTIHHDKLQEVFGARSSKLSQYLREQLLVRSGSYAVGSVSFGYKLNRAGYKRLKAICDPLVKSADVQVENPLIQAHAAELQELQFEYKESSDRYWHPLQNVRRDAKDEFWAPYLPFDYDIEACAPTVLYQLSRKYELPALVTEAVQDYLKNKQQFREYVAALTGLDYSDAKRLVNSMFNGARLTPHWSCAAYRLLGYDAERLNALKNDDSVRKLRAGIRRIWIRIALKLNLNLGTGRAKWTVYFKIERSIIDVIRDELRLKNVRVFTEHDGFRTNVQIDKNELIEAIKQRTGFELKLSGPSTK